MCVRGFIGHHKPTVHIYPMFVGFFQENGSFHMQVKKKVFLGKNEAHELNIILMTMVHTYKCLFGVYWESQFPIAPTGQFFVGFLIIAYPSK